MADLPPIYAHRLGSGYGPESSLMALEGSIARRVDGLEADVVITADEEVFALHDPILSISTDAEGWVSEVQAMELRRASLRRESGKPSDQHPISLGEALEAAGPDLPIQLDVKAYADHALACRTAELACRVAIEHGTAERVELISFFSRACLAATELGIKAGLAAWADYDPEAMADWASAHGCSGVSMEGFVVNSRIAKALKDAGLTLAVGTVNTVDQALRVLPFDPDILVSDRPRELADELDEYI
jgi:glycerophosphoryl diester phosphodiesterase